MGAGMLRRGRTVQVARGLACEMPAAVPWVEAAVDHVKWATCKMPIQWWTRFYAIYFVPNRFFAGFSREHIFFKILCRFPFVLP